MARIAARSLPTPDPRLVRALRRLALFGALLVLALPAAGDAGIGRERRRRAPQARRRRQYPAASRAFSASMRPISISSAARQNS